MKPLSYWKVFLNEKNMFKGINVNYKTSLIHNWVCLQQMINVLFEQNLVFCCCSVCKLQFSNKLANASVCIINSFSLISLMFFSFLIKMPWGNSSSQTIIMYKKDDLALALWYHATDSYFLRGKISFFSIKSNKILFIYTLSYHHYKLINQIEMKLIDSMNFNPI